MMLKFNDLYQQIDQSIQNMNKPLHNQKLSISFAHTQQVEAFDENTIYSDGAMNDIESNQIQEIIDEPVDEPDELDLILKQREEAQALLNAILPTIKLHLDACTKIRDDYSNWSLAYIAHRASMLTYKNDKEDENKKLRAHLTGLYKKFAALKKEVEEDQNEIMKKVNAANKRKKELKRWCWVPCYGLYLVVDDEVVSAQEKKDIKEKNLKLQKLCKEMDDGEDELNQMEHSSTSLVSLYSVLNRENEKVTKRLNHLSEMVVQWNQFYSFYVKLQSDLEAVDNVFEVFLMAQKQMNQAIKEEEKFGDQELEVPELYMGDYAIFTYDGRYRFMEANESLIINEDWNFSQLFLKYRGNAEKDLHIITMADGKNMILTSNNYVLTSEPFGNTHFEPLQGDVLPNQSFYFIEDPDHPYLYFITNQKEKPQMQCLDVCREVYANETEICMWEFLDGMNQRFRIKRVEDLPPIIGFPSDPSIDPMLSPIDGSVVGPICGPILGPILGPMGPLF